MRARRTKNIIAIGAALALAASISLSSAISAQALGLEVVQAFDADAEELPEGIAIGADGDLFLTMGYPSFFQPGDGWIKHLAPDGTKTTLATFVAGQGPAGIVTNADGDVYFARPNPSAPDSRGVYRLHPDGTTERLPGSEEILMANGIAFDGRGGLLVGDSALGIIWRVPLDGSGVADAWASQPELLGGCGEGTFGVNGVAIWEDQVYAANTGRGLLVRIPVLADGSAGAGTLVAGDATNECEPDALFGMDGIALDVNGTVYALLVLQNQLVRIDPTDGSFDVLLTERDGLHNPASLAFGTQDGDRQSLFFTN
jgi:sugar lactone lactonase YvrE